MKTAVVTGASGFLGSHLCLHLLSRGYRVKALVRRPFDADEISWLIPWYPGADLSLFTAVTADVSDPQGLEDALAGSDVVFHCAAMISFNSKDRDQMMETNVTGTANVVNTCLRTGVPALIHASSVAALGRTEKISDISENSEWTDSPLNTDYAVSKHLAETEVWRGMEEGLQVAMVHPGIILGPHPGKTGSGMIFTRAASGSRIYPAGTNGFVGVKDVAVMMEMLYAQEHRGLKVLAVSENWSYRHLLTRISEIMGKPAPDIKIPAGFARFMARIFRTAERLGVPVPYPSHGLVSTSAVSRYHPANAGLLHGFRFTPLDDVLVQSIQLLKEANKLP